MLSYQVVNNVLPQRFADAIEQDIQQNDFPWYYLNDVTNSQYGTNYGFVNLLYNNGCILNDYYKFFKPAIFQIAEAVNAPIQDILRVRIGFLLPTNTATQNTPHVDFYQPHLTACYYVNNSDGNTVIYDKTIKDVGKEYNDPIVKEFVGSTKFTTIATCSPEKNKVLVFNGQHFHSSSNPSSTKRLVITINWIP